MAKDIVTLYQQRLKKGGGGQTIFLWVGFVVCIVVCFGIKSLEKKLVRLV